MEIKIKNIRIQGLRGMKDVLTLPVDGKSVLLYGDNGSGKSSISDSIEWFFTDNVEHLSSSEIDLKEALRNSFIKNEENSFVELSFSKKDINNTKKLFYKKNKLLTEFLGVSDVFNDYLGVSKDENLLLRYQNLTDFIDQTKGDKLKYLSDIIGFGEVTKAKEVLQKSFNSIKSDIKNQNFSTQISIQKQILIDKIGASVSQHTNFLSTINQFIKPLNLGLEVTKITDIDIVLKQIQKPGNTKVIGELNSLENIQNALSGLKAEIDILDKVYGDYFKEFEIIANDLHSVIQILLGELLKAGKVVLDKEYHTEKSCPLCLQSKDIKDLKVDIEKRLQTIEESAKKKIPFDNARKNLLAIATERISRLNALNNDPLLSKLENKEIKEAIEGLKSKIEKYQIASNEKVMSGNRLPKASDIKLGAVDFKIQNNIAGRIKKIEEDLAKDNSAIVYANISAATDAFKKIKLFELQETKLEEQKKSFELIYNEFIKKQKEGLEDFVNTFSSNINEYYQYMNPGELFQEIRIITIGEEDELKGITIEYKYNGKWVLPPQKYFSESHLNCFGISFFLASVLAFNHSNKFIVLDDVISSFDTNHRIKFAQLLIEKFSDYQLILLTHEEQWYEYMRQLAKRKGWMIKEIKWTDAKGTHLEEGPNELRDVIEENLAKGDIGFLGNPMRKYLEHMLKEICVNLDVKVNFRYNEINEKRMPDELLNELKSKISKSSSDLKGHVAIIDRVANSTVLGNLLSHDNPFNPKIGDLNAFWNDVNEMRKLFYCQNSTCQKPNVSIKNYDSVAKMIRCGCGTTKYSWKD
jgi:energy-coupling factor transporter ATP-binding protein EcfA2